MSEAHFKRRRNTPHQRQQRRQGSSSQREAVRPINEVDDFGNADPCAFAPCKHSSTCEWTPNSNPPFICHCSVGYKGERCQKESEGVQCDFKNCQVKSNGHRLLNVDETAIEMVLAVGPLLLLIAVIVTILIVHCFRVFSRKKKEEAIYQKRVLAGETPETLPPGCCELSNVVFMETLCCMNWIIKRVKQEQDQTHVDQLVSDLKLAKQMKKSRHNIDPKEKELLFKRISSVKIKPGETRPLLDNRTKSKESPDRRYSKTKPEPQMSSKSNTTRQGRPTKTKQLSDNEISLNPPQNGSFLPRKHSKSTQCRESIKSMCRHCVNCGGTRASHKTVKSSGTLPCYSNSDVSGDSEDGRGGKLYKPSTTRVISPVCSEVQEHNDYAKPGHMDSHHVMSSERSNVHDPAEYQKPDQTDTQRISFEKMRCSRANVLKKSDDNISTDECQKSAESLTRSKQSSSSVIYDLERVRGSDHESESLQMKFDILPQDERGPMVYCPVFSNKLQDVNNDEQSGFSVSDHVHRCHSSNSKNNKLHKYESSGCNFNGTRSNVYNLPRDSGYYNQKYYHSSRPKVMQVPEQVSQTDIPYSGHVINKPTPHEFSNEMENLHDNLAYGHLQSASNVEDHATAIRPASKQMFYAEDTDVRATSSSFNERTKNDKRSYTRIMQNISDLQADVDHRQSSAQKFWNRISSHNVSTPRDRVLNQLTHGVREVQREDPDNPMVDSGIEVNGNDSISPPNHMPTRNLLLADIVNNKRALQDNETDVVDGEIKENTPLRNTERVLRNVSGNNGHLRSDSSISSLALGKNYPVINCQRHPCQHNQKNSSIALNDDDSRLTYRVAPCRNISRIKEHNHSGIFGNENGNQLPDQVASSRNISRKRLQRQDKIRNGVIYKSSEGDFIERQCRTIGSSVTPNTESHVCTHQSECPSLYEITHFEHFPEADSQTTYQNTVELNASIQNTIFPDRNRRNAFPKGSFNNAPISSSTPKLQQDVDDELQDVWRRRHIQINQKPRKSSAASILEAIRNNESVMNRFISNHRHEHNDIELNNEKHQRNIAHENVNNIPASLHQPLPSNIHRTRTPRNVKSIIAHFDKNEPELEDNNAKRCVRRQLYSQGNFRSNVGNYDVDNHYDFDDDVRQNSGSSSSQTLSSLKGVPSPSFNKRVESTLTSDAGSSGNIRSNTVYSESYYSRHSNDFPPPPSRSELDQTYNTSSSNLPMSSSYYQPPPPSDPYPN